MFGPRFRSQGEGPATRRAADDLILRLANFLEKCIDPRPQRLPFLPLGLGELGQGLRVADRGQIDVDLPVLEGLDNLGSRIRVAVIHQLWPGKDPRSNLGHAIVRNNWMG